MIIYEPRNPWSTLFWIKGSVILPNLPPALFCGLLGTLGVYLNMESDTSIDKTSHTLLGTSLGFLLVFRSTLANQRFWDGRSYIGQILCSMRSYIIHVRAFAVGNDRFTRKFHADSCRLMNVLLYSIVMNLRKRRNVNGSCRIGQYLNKSEFLIWDSSSNRPLLVLAWLNEISSNAHRHHGVVEKQALKLFSRDINDALSGCHGVEKIRNTPIPFPYYQLCNFLMLFFAISVPFVIASYNTSFFTAPLFSFMVTLGFFAMNRMGNELQDPFGTDPNDLPLENFARALEADIRELFPEFKAQFPNELWPVGHRVEEDGDDSAPKTAEGRFKAAASAVMLINNSRVAGKIAAAAKSASSEPKQKTPKVVPANPPSSDLSPNAPSPHLALSNSLKMEGSEFAEMLLSPALTPSLQPNGTDEVPPAPLDDPPMKVRRGSVTTHSTVEGRNSPSLKKSPPMSKNPANSSEDDDDFPLPRPRTGELQSTVGPNSNTGGEAGDNGTPLVRSMSRMQSLRGRFDYNSVRARMIRNIPGSQAANNS